jgi:hypothetical protein
MYTVVLLIVLGAALGSLAMRKPFKVDILRDRASLVKETDAGCWKMPTPSRSSTPQNAIRSLKSR